MGPILQQWAVTEDLPLVLLLTCGKAESGFDPNAFVGGLPADTSVGPYQQTIIYANGFGVGDGTVSAANIAYCRDAFKNWDTSTRVAAQNLKPRYVAAQLAQFSGDDLIIATCGSYNSGHLEPFGNWWWSSPQFYNYRAALTWAQGVLG